MQYASLKDIEPDIITPGIEKHLKPLIAYRGNLTIGRAQRLWNFSIAMMHQDCSDFSEGRALSHNPDFSHLLGPEDQQTYQKVRGFFNRLALNPKVTDNVRGLTRYVKALNPRPWHYTPVSEYTSRRETVGAGGWRTYIAAPQRKVNAALDKAPRAAEMVYPYMVHDGKSDAGADLVKVVNTLVPRGLPPEVRADVCQDIIVAILSEQIALADLSGATVKDFVSVGRKFFQDKWQLFSLEDKGHTDQALIDTLSEADGLWPQY